MAAIRMRVEGARAQQAARFATAVGADGRPPLLATNAEMGPTKVRDHPGPPGRQARAGCAVDEAGRQLLGAAMRHTCPGAARQGRCRGMHLSSRAYHRILKLARTIADLAGAERIQPAYLAEAIHLRTAAADGVGGAVGLKNPPQGGVVDFLAMFTAFCQHARMALRH